MTGQGTHPKFQDGSGDPEEVRDGSGTLGKVWDGSWDPQEVRDG